MSNDKELTPNEFRAIEGYIIPNAEKLCNYAERLERELAETKRDKSGPISQGYIKG